MKTRLYLILSILLVANQVSAQILVDSLEIVMKREVNSRRSVSITAGVIELNKKHIVAAGKVDKNTNGLPDGNTVYEIGSVTKLFTSLLLADLIVKGQLTLDDPISKFLPAAVKTPKRDGKEITLRSLATHTSGLPDMPTNIAVNGVSNPYAKYTVKEAYEFLSGYTLNRSVGAKYEYSNYGAALLGHVLTIVAGADYETLVKQRICIPLKMRSTSITINSKQKKNIATGYDRYGRPVVSYLDFDFFESAAAIRSTVNDLLLFASANLGLSKTKLDAAIRLAQTIQDSTGLPNMKVALGWHSLDRYNNPLLWHNGQTGGFKSFIGLDKEHKTAIVVLSNGGNPIDDIAFHTLNKNYKLQSFKYPWVIKDTIVTIITNRGIPAGLQLYTSLKKEQRSEYIFNEMQLSVAGAELSQNKKLKEAIAIYKLNAEEYPKSWRAFNNLGESYIADGNEKLAIEAYERSVELNPGNQAVVDSLRKLKKEDGL